VLTYQLSMNKRLILLGIVFLIVLLSPVLQAQSIVAQFTASVRQGCAPLTVQFSNHSINASTYHWDFGNGNSSNISNPTTLYTTKGAYTVRLIVGDSNNNYDTLEFSQMIKVGQVSQVDFSYSMNSSCLNEHRIDFSNKSIETQNYLWDFGDGYTSTLENPSHVYQDTGSYLVKLVATDSIGCAGIKQANQPIRIIQKTEASILVDTTESCDSSHAFAFTTIPNSFSAYRWYFGDGDSSVLMNPAHTYWQAGSFDVRLQVVDSNGCSDTVQQNDFIRVHSPPRVAFTTQVLNSCFPVSVLCNADTLPGAQYSWDFGNGSTGYSHLDTGTYQLAGSYSLKLKVEDAHACVDSLSHNLSINAGSGSTAAFWVDTLTFCVNTPIPFTNQSTRARSYLWNFGDGNTSTLENPVHSYERAGNYRVLLTVTDSSACSQLVASNVEVRRLSALFSADKREGCGALQVQFSNLSRNATQWLWDFGDGLTSQQEHPQHTYLNSGTYSVRLIASSPFCADTMIWTNYVKVHSDTLHKIAPDTIYSCLPVQLDLGQNTEGNTQWLWNFGDGGTSTLASPFHLYDTAGIYTISLATIGEGGCPMFIENYAVVVANGVDFAPEILAVDCQQNVVHFTDSTPTATQWLWDFGDGTYSTLQSPVHKYSDTLVFDLTLTITTEDGCIKSVFYPQMVDMQQCSINANVPVQVGGGSQVGNWTNGDTLMRLATKCAPQTVQFYNPHPQANSWWWDFGDGTTSQQAQASHLYANPGVYDVRLIAYYPNRNDTSVFTNYVKVNGPDASFSISTQYFCDSVQVQFNDASQRAQNWSWSFGNGDTSVQRNPLRSFGYSNTNKPVYLRVVDSVGCPATRVKMIEIKRQHLEIEYEDRACINDTVYFSTSDSGLKHYWTFGDGSSDTSSRAMHVFRRAGTYAVHLRTVNAALCEENYVLDSIRVEGATASFTISDTQACVNNFITFKADDLEADSYAWDFGGRWQGSQSTEYRMLPVPGIYEVQLNVSSEGCTDSYTHPMKVSIGKADAAFTIEQINDCYPPELELRDTSAKSVSWLWMVNNDTLSAVNPVRFLAGDSSINVSMKVSAQNGCFAESRRSYQPRTVKAAFAISDTLGCAPFTVHFNNQSTNAISHLWLFGDGDTSILKDPIHAYTEAGTYTVQLIVGGAEGCYDTLIRSQLIKVSTVEADYSTQFNSSCAPMVVNFIDATADAVSWEWKFGDGTASTLAHPVHIYDNSGHFTVQLVVKNEQGCADTLSKSESILVPGPQAFFTLSDTLSCGEDSVYFQDASSNAVEWTWYFDDGMVSNKQHPSHFYTVAGSYNVTLITKDSSGCSGFYTHPSPVRKGDLPKVFFSINDTTECAPHTLELKSERQEELDITWSINDSIKSLKDSLLYTIQAPGAYSIAMKAQTAIGCVNTFTFDSLILKSSGKVNLNDLDPFCENDTAYPLPVPCSGNWQGVGLVSSDSTGPFFDPQLAGKGQVSIFFTPDEACVLGDTIDILVKEAPKASFSVNDTVLCFGSPLVLSIDTAPIAHLKPRYTWEANNSTVGHKANVSTVLGPGVHGISLQVNYNNGCSAYLEKESYVRVNDSLPFIGGIKKASVTGAEEVKVHWSRDTSVQFNYYRIMRKSDALPGYVEIKRVEERNQLSYIDQRVDATNHVYCYKVLSVDACGNETALEDAPTHCTVNVSAEKIDAHSVKIAWTEYIGDSIHSYHIMRRESATGVPMMLCAVSPETSFIVDTSAFCNIEYFYQIKVNFTHNANIAWSDLAGEEMEGVLQQHKASIIRASVEDDNAVQIEWEIDSSYLGAINGFVIYRSEDNIAYSPVIFINAAQRAYIDRQVEVDEKNYYYKVAAITICGESDLSEQASSILLRSEKIDDEKFLLEWTPYEQWKEGVEGYEIQKKNEFGEWETIKIVPRDANESIIEY
jgi:PKD repeat protein